MRPALPGLRGRYRLRCVGAARPRRCSFRIALLVLRKDFAIEVEEPAKSSATTLFFAVSCMLDLLVRVRRAKAQAVAGGAAAGILWIAIAFSGTLALGRTFERERYGETLRALLLAPAPRAGDLRRQAAGHDRADARRPSCSLVPLVALLFHAPLFDQPLLLWRSWCRARSASPRRDAVRGDAGPRPDPRRHAADPLVSDHRSGDDCRRSGHGRAAAAEPDDGRWPSMWISLLAASTRVRDAVAVDVRTADDGMRKSAVTLDAAAPYVL